jgi:transposase-like protein
MCVKRGEKRLEEEMAEYLGVSRYEHGADRVDYRNGYYVRQLLTETAGY